METRKLIKFGKNSYVVSLPKEWVAQHKLEKGSELHVEEQPGLVEIRTTAPELEEREGKIDCDGKTITAVETEISCLYKMGRTPLVIQGKCLPEHVTEVRELLLGLAGVEIIEQDLHRIVAKDLIDVRQIALPTLINRMDMMIRSMFQDTLGEEQVANRVLRDRDRDVNRLQLLVARVMRIVFDNPAIAAPLKLTVRTAHYYARIAWSLERIGDYVKRANGDMEASGKASRKRVKAQLAIAYQKYLATMKAYYQASPAKAFLLHDEVARLLGQFTRHVYAAKETPEVLALENIKNVLRDLRIILRITAEYGTQKA